VALADEPRHQAERVLPQSLPQQRLWFLNAYEPDDAGYNVVGAYRLRGPLDVGALREALLDLERSHPILRTRFPVAAEGPVQVVCPPGRLLLEEVASKPDEVLEKVASAFRRTFDLEQGPVARVLLVDVTAQDHILALVMHHIVCDQRSWQLLLSDLRALYAARHRREQFRLSASSIRYEDYLEWERQELTGEVMSRQLGYWEQRLGELPPPMNLVSRRAEEGSPGPARPRSRSVGLPREMLTQAQALARQEKTTPFVIFLALCAASLCRRVLANEVVVGCPVTTRAMPGSEDLVGFFVNIVVVRVAVLADDTPRALVRRVRETVIDALDNSQVPYQEVVARIAGRRAQRRSLYEVSFNLLDETDVEEFRLDGLQVTPYPAVEPGIRHMLSFMLTLRPDGAELRGVFDENELSVRLVDDLLAACRDLAIAALRAPDQPVDDC
jgi:hypothetical protein